MGGDLPPSKLNHAPKPGLHFDHPCSHGGTLADPEFGTRATRLETTPEDRAS